MCHVLIIEDEWFILELLIDLAEEAGATSIATATTQNEAIMAARDQLPAIILSDVNLHVGTGPMAVQTITAEAGNIPVIFITGTPEDCKPREPSAVVLCKPIQRHLVIETFRQLAAL